MLPGPGEVMCGSKIKARTTAGTRNCKHDQKTSTGGRSLRRGTKSALGQDPQRAFHPIQGDAGPTDYVPNISGLVQYRALGGTFAYPAISRATRNSALLYCDDASGSAARAAQVRHPARRMNY